VRNFRVVLVDGGHGAGAQPAPFADKEIRYEDSELHVVMK
jgi:hypothetical protein